MINIMASSSFVFHNGALIETNLPTTDNLKHLSRGKVRDLYTVSGEEGQFLLFVATDRISAFDVVLKNGIPDKGCLLTELSYFWFNRLKHIIPNHLISVYRGSNSNDNETPQSVRKMLAPYEEHLKDRTMLVRTANVIPIEAIVRGYLTGSAWSEYRKSQTVHGISLPPNLVECQKLDPPLFTPSTKAEAGMHDENISPEKAAELIGVTLYNHIASTAIQLYKEANEYALTRGLILADTKFEFGLIPHTAGSSTSTKIIVAESGVEEELILVDEVLTPDSSRYWSLANYVPGRPQASFDKQFLRDWLVKTGFRKGLEKGPDGTENGWWMTPEVVDGTRERYETAVKALVSIQI